MRRPTAMRRPTTRATLALVLSAALALGGAACGSYEDGDSAGQQQDQEQQQDDGGGDGY